MVQKIAITGSLKWDDRIKIKEVIYKLKQKFGPNLYINGGGLTNGVDSIVKKFCLEFDIEFVETPPHNCKWNQYCTEPSYMYNKAYHSKNIYIRNTRLANETSTLILFRLTDDASPFLDDLINRFYKKDKKILVIN